VAERFAGVTLLIVASIVNTGFAVFMKRTRGWNFENSWFAWALLALIVLPLALSSATIPGLAQVYAGDAPVVFHVAALGFAWGVSQIFLGMAVEAAGIGVSFAVILGMSAVVGSIVPLATHGAHALLALGGIGPVAGIAIMVAGVGACARAGWLRDHAQRIDSALATRGLVYCLLAGAGSGLMNLGLVLGAPIISAAQRSGAQSIWAPNAAWLPFLWSGALPNLAYCLWRLKRNHSFKRYLAGENRSSWRFALLMSTCWLGSALLYALGAREMGTWGPVFAWPVYMSLIVISGTVAGVLMGEWKSSSPVPLWRMTQGVGLLTTAIFLLAGAGK
jgi:L-rhamnose-H+ transport protein